MLKMMNKLYKVENGFSVVELAIIVIIVAIIAVFGWVIYKNHHKPTISNATTSSSNKVANSSKASTPVTTTNPNTSSTFCTTDTTNANAVYGPVISAQNGYLDLDAVGLRIPTNSSLDGLVAVCVPPYNDGSTAASQSPLITTYQFSTTELEQANSNCTPSQSNSMGSTEILSKNDTSFADDGGMYIGQAGKYFLYYVPPQDTCYINGTPPNSFSSQRSQDIQDIQAALKNTTPI